MLERRGRLEAGKTRMELRGLGYGFCPGHRAVLGARGECQVSGGGVLVRLHCLATVWPGLALNCLALGAGVVLGAQHVPPASQAAVRTGRGCVTVFWEGQSPRM